MFPDRIVVKDITDQGLIDTFYAFGLTIVEIKRTYYPHWNRAENRMPTLASLEILTLHNESRRKWWMNHERDGSNRLIVSEPLRGHHD